MNTLEDVAAERSALDCINGEFSPYILIDSIDYLGILNDIATGKSARHRINGKFPFEAVI